MAIYRNIQMTFWTDSNIVDNFTPEDRYFYLYILTNPHTNLCGCYEISLKQISDETGYTKEVVEKLLERLETVHDVIRYSKATKELLVVNWSKFNWTKSKDFQKPLIKEIECVKSKEFQGILYGLVDGVETVPGRSQDGVGTTVTDIYIKDITETKVIDTYSKDIMDIINYLNIRTGKKYTGKTKSHREHIIARLKDGFTVDDFKTVIDNQIHAWGNDEKMKQYIRPETLFCGKFETYLNNVEDVKQKRKREDREINERQRNQYDDATAHFFE